MKTLVVDREERHEDTLVPATGEGSPLIVNPHQQGKEDLLAIDLEGAIEDSRF